MESGSARARSARFARDLGWEFFDADDFHPAENVAKMRAGHPYDGCRPRARLERRASELLRGQPTRRARLLRAARCPSQPAAREFHRRTSGLSARQPAVLGARLAGRRGHSCRPMLASQLATLEEPRDALVVDLGDAPATIAERIRTGLVDRLTTTSPAAKRRSPRALSHRA
jgi:gluconokinase